MEPKDSSCTNTLVGVEINGYKLIEEIGTTNHSFVYKASFSNNRIYCIKLIKRDKNKEDLNTPKIFCIESNALTILNHNSIVQVFDSFVVDHFFILISEYMSNNSLHEILQQRHFLSNEEAQRLIFSLTLALQYCHMRNVAHRNIKPSNIMFNNNRVAFTDFNISIHKRSDNIKIPISSLPYTAPEILKNTNSEDNDFPDERSSDIWSLGVILYQVLSGRLPWSATHYNEIAKQIKQGVYSFTPRIVPLARDLISKMLVIEPLHRITFHEIIAHPWLTKIKTTSIRSKKGKICFINIIN